VPAAVLTHLAHAGSTPAVGPREGLSLRFALVVGAYLLAMWAVWAYPAPEAFTPRALCMHTARMPLWLVAQPVRALATVPVALYGVWALLVQPYGGRF